MQEYKEILIELDPAQKIQNFRMAMRVVAHKEGLAMKVRCKFSLVYLK